ncbi:TY-Chap2 family putative peptide chaperone [Demequina gelatinilytica]|uniref:TY-Chap2 family putative peptide chaperone n=1 Tax=Demequina gelatinilytica TaxID=1638980 RepID=UPI000784C591|nr:hypothetical protein [Demequina gelatinilytica]
MSGTKVFRAADRFVDAQLWWVASELCRRHPRLGLIESVYDEVGIVVEAVGTMDGREVRVGFSRAAGVAIKDREFGVAPPALLEQVNPHAILRRIEDAHGMGKPAETPATTAVTVGYRAIAWVLGAMVNSRYSWTLRGERAEDPHVLQDLSWMGEAAGWASLEGLRDFWRAEAEIDELYVGPVSQAWLLMRDLEPVAVFDRYGYVRTVHGATILLETYRGLGSNLAPAVVRALGRWMQS